MGEVGIIGLDLAKNVFQVHGAGSDGSVVFRRKLSRLQLLRFLAEQPPCMVAMEACASAHHWGRKIGELGHMVRLIAPAYVKTFVKRQKNDAADAEALLSSTTRMHSRTVARGQGSRQLRRPSESTASPCAKFLSPPVTALSTPLETSDGVRCGGLSTACLRRTRRND